MVGYDLKAAFGPLCHCVSEPPWRKWTGRVEMAGSVGAWRRLLTFQLMGSQNPFLLGWIGFWLLTIKRVLSDMFYGHNSEDINQEKRANRLPDFICVLNSPVCCVPCWFLCILIHINCKAQSSWGRRELRVSYFKEEKLGNLKWCHEKSGALLLSSVVRMWRPLSLFWSNLHCK